MSMKAKLIVQSVLFFVLAFALLFLPAGRLDFWEAWAYLGIIFIPMAVFTIYYYKRDPDLVRRRMQYREKVKEQKWIMRVGMIVTVVGTVIPGLDHRLGWTRKFFGGVPLWLEISALFIALAGYLETMWVMDVNRFAARTIQVEEGQKVISTGPYGVVRHPLYAGGVLMWLASAPALGSYVATPFFLLLIPTFVLRILNEERVLRKELPGYPDYCERVQYRLLPHVW